MAVIDTSMIKPKSCDVCPYCRGENLTCLKDCFIPLRALDNEFYLHKKCPLKSTDEMIAEIHSLLDFWGRYKKNRLVYDILEVIDEYCGG